MPKRVWVAAAAALFGMAPAAALAQPDFSIADPKWSPWAEVGGFYGSTGASRGEAVFWAPLMGAMNSLAFVEIRGKLFADANAEGNIAFGYRRMLPGGWNLGAWGGHDIRLAGGGATFHQLSGGVEALGERLAFRANGYLPINNSAVIGTSTSTVSEVRLLNNNTNIALFTDTITKVTRQLALAGVDAEAGFGQPFRALGRNNELWLYAGGFYFNHPDLPAPVVGPKLRLEWQVNDIIRAVPGSRLTAEASASYDAVRGARWDAGLRLRLPLRPEANDPPLSRQQLRMAEALHRDTDIVSSQTTSSSITNTEYEAVVDAATGVRLDRVVFADSANGLANGAALGANTLLIAQGGNGIIDVTGLGGLTLRADQTLQGGGSVLKVLGVNTGIAADFTAPGARPTIQSFVDDADAGAITVASRNHVLGLDLLGDGGCGCTYNQGIRGGSNLDTVVIEQNHLADFGDSGILFDGNNRNLIIRNNAIENSNYVGIGIGFDNRSVTISGNTLKGFDRGILIWQGNQDVVISDNSIQDAFEGIEVTDSNRNVSIRNNTIANAFAGVFVLSDNKDISVEGNAISNVVFGIGLLEGNQAISIADNTLTDTGVGVLVGDFGGAALDNNDGVMISGNKISGAGVIGILVDNGNSNISVANNIIAQDATSSLGIGINEDNKGISVTGNRVTGGLQGISVGDGNSGLDISGNTLKDILDSGIWLGDGNTGTISGNLLTGSIGGDGLRVGQTNDLTVSANRFEAAFGDDVVQLDDNNILTGSGNTFTGPTPGGFFCNAPGAQTGSIGFSTPPATCP